MASAYEVLAQLSISVPILLFATVSVAFLSKQNQTVLRTLLLVFSLTGLVLMTILEIHFGVWFYLSFSILTVVSFYSSKKEA